MWTSSFALSALCYLCIPIGSRKHSPRPAGRILILPLAKGRNKNEPSCWKNCSWSWEYPRKEGNLSSKMDGLNPIAKIVKEDGIEWKLGGRWRFFSSVVKIATRTEQNPLWKKKLHMNRDREQAMPNWETFLPNNLSKVPKVPFLPWRVFSQL